MLEQPQPLYDRKCQRCKSDFKSTTMFARYCTMACQTEASNARRRNGAPAGKIAHRQTKEAKERLLPKSEAPPPSAPEVEELIRGGYLPVPFIRTANDDRPLWTFEAVAQLFDLTQVELIKVLRQNGSVHSEVGQIPSSWDRFKSM